MLTRSQKSLMKRWIKALRNGKYKQGRNTLRSGDCFCVLGVLCDIVDPNGWSIICDEYCHNNNRCLPGHKVMKSVPFLSFSDEVILSTMNDKRHFSFNSLANYLERKYLSDNTRTKKSVGRRSTKRKV